MSHKAEPLGGPIISNRTLNWVLWLAIIGMALVVWRLVSGLGAVTALSDGYPWGLWIVMDVVTGTALACGGYAIALLVYIFNQGRYHPLVRPALLTSLLGYSLAGFAIHLDVGRYWLLWRVFDPRKWNLNSVLLEVALCVAAYILVLFIELLPAFLEKWDSADGFMGSLSRGLVPVLNKLLIFFIALGILLPTMHQSSLGSLLLIAVKKVHPLWHTPLLPLLFLISVIGMGYAAVIFEATISAVALKRKPETDILSKLHTPIIVTLLGYVAIRLVDLAVRGRIGLMFGSGFLSVMFWLEIGLFVLPAILLMKPATRADIGSLFRVAMLIIAGAALYRFDAYLVAYNPGDNWTYFPSVPEIGVTVGIFSVEILLYVAIIKRFPILSRAPSARA